MSQILAGGAVAIFAFVLAYLRDERKSAIESRRKDERVMSALRTEIATNLVVVENLGELVREDVRQLKQGGGMLMNPLDLLAPATGTSSRFICLECSSRTRPYCRVCAMLFVAPSSSTQ